MMKTSVQVRLYSHGKDLLTLHCIRLYRGIRLRILHSQPSAVPALYPEADSMKVVMELRLHSSFLVPTQQDVH